MQVATATSQSSAASLIPADLQAKFAGRMLAEQFTCDGIPTVWVDRGDVVEFLRELRDGSEPRFEMLFDLTAIDERMRTHRESQPPSEFTVVYHLMSFSGNCDFRVKVPLMDADLNIPTVTGLWPAANWYEREAWDMFAINFEGHPNLYRLILPPTWEGHPAQGTSARAEKWPYSLDDAAGRTGAWSIRTWG